MMIIYGKRDKSDSVVQFIYLKFLKCDSRRGYSGFYHLPIIYEKRENVDKRFLYSQISVMR